MFAYKEEFKYPCLSLLGRLGVFQDLKESKVPAFEEYVDQYEGALQQKNLKVAFLNARKAALYYGAPGLILYFNVILEDIKQEKTKGELTGQLVVDALRYLLLAQKLLEHEGVISKQLIKEHLSNEDINSPDYWESKRAALSNLETIAPISEKDAIASAKEMFDECLNKVTYPEIFPQMNGKK